jgi:hypothetical protein
LTVTDQPVALEDHGASPGHHNRWEGRDTRAAALLLLLLLPIYLLTATYTLEQLNDTRATAISAWSLGARGTLALPAEWLEEHIDWGVQGRDGRTYTDRFPGATVWAAPFYSVTELFTPRASSPPHPYLLNYAPAAVAAAFATALAIVAAFLVYRRIESRRRAWLAALFLGLGTGMWSVAADAMWTHGVGSLFLLLGVLASGGRRYALAGVAFGVAILCRPQYAVIPAIIGIWEGYRFRDLLPVIKIGALSSVGLALMSIYSQFYFGTWLPIAGYGAKKVGSVASIGGADFLENVVLGLVHPYRGILIYTPILLLLLPGIDRGWRVAPPWVRSAAVAGVVYAVVQLRANGWYGGLNYFGSRLLLETLVLASPLLLLTLRHYVLPTGRRAVRISLVVVLAASLLTHALGATTRSEGLYVVERPFAERWDEFCRQEPDECDRLEPDVPAVLLSD